MTFSWSSACRLALAGPAAGLLCLVASPAAAAATPAPSPSASASPTASATPDPSQQAASLQAAQQQLQQAQTAATAQDTALAQAQQNLASVQTTIGALQAEIDAYDQQISGDQDQAQRLQGEIGYDRQQLADYLRAAYERGSDSSLYYIWSSTSFADMLARSSQVNQVSDRGNALLARITFEQQSVQNALDDSQQKRSDVEAAHQQSTTEAELLNVELEKVQVADQQAQAAVQWAQANVAAVQAGQVVSPGGSSSGRTGVVYAPIPGVNFTIDTDLTVPSGETAARLDAFLLGSAFQGLGSAYLAAETKWHVSARYLLAHSIEESAFGTSQIARDKHNIFGYGAYDSNPYNGAYTFPDFAACIDFVAGMVAQNYLIPTGPYFHGPTLRGMNVSYATDPNWANNIARIANSFP